MFDAIAPTYDFLNRVISLGMDVAWRKKAVQMCLSDHPRSVLDLGAGTGDVALMIARATHPKVRIIAADFSLSMLRRAAYRSRRSGASLKLAAADAANLPFTSRSIDAVVIAFTLRNVPDLRGALQEVAKVLTAEGRLVVLEMTPVHSSILGRLFRFYFHSLVPLIGRVVSGHPFAYRYLPQSVDEFPAAPHLAELMLESGFRDVSYSKLAMGSIAIHTGIK